MYFISVLYQARSSQSYFMLVTVTDKLSVRRKYVQKFIMFIIFNAAPFYAHTNIMRRESSKKCPSPDHYFKITFRKLNFWEKKISCRSCLYPLSVKKWKLFLFFRLSKINNHRGRSTSIYIFMYLPPQGTIHYWCKGSKKGTKLMDIS